ncbi:MAG: [Fe-Fe] hydrogenase large subunit C-terminal domain-containing protein [Candidatus Gastranaerophilaceae bacterium]
MIALNIQVAECGESEFKNESSAEGRNFCVTGGVAKAVQTLLPEEIPAHPVVIDGLTKQSVRDLKKYAKNGVCELGNLIEIMACTGGCLGGNSTVNAFKPALKQVTNYVNKSSSIKEQVEETVKH